MSFFRTFLKKPSYGSLFSAIFANNATNVERAISFGQHKRNLLDVYRPKKTGKNPPIVIFFYGGGWEEGERESYGFVGAALANCGFVTVIPDYRLYPEVQYPEFMADAGEAYNWVVQEFITNNERPAIFVMGHSAGAHIGALLTYSQAHLGSPSKSLSKPDGFIGLSGPYGFDPTKYKRTKHVFENVQKPADVQPIFQVTKGAPPALLLHGAKDTTVLTLNAIKMRDALLNVGAQARSIEFEKIGHVGLLLTLSRPFRFRATALDCVKKFVTSQSELGKTNR